MCINYFSVASIFALGRMLASLKWFWNLKTQNLVFFFFALQESFQVLEACRSPDKLAESFIVGESAVILLCEDMVNILHAPIL